MKQYAIILFLSAFCMAITALNATNKKEIHVIFIGNSVTYGAGLEHPETDAPPVKCAALLGKEAGISRVQFVNCGVSGSTTLDFLPDSGSLYPNVIHAADSLSQDRSAILVFSIMLGTNDSAERGPHGSPVSPDAYQRNMQTIIDRLFTYYPACKVIVHQPTWYSPNTYNGAVYLQKGLDRLNSYFPLLKQMVEKYQTRHVAVYPGDTEAYSFFEKNHKKYLQAEQGNAWTFYLHPNVEGAAILGQFWEQAIYRMLREK